MDRVNIKYAPAIHDFTAEDVAEEDDEGMEAVLMDKGRLVEESKPNFMTRGKASEGELLEIIRKRDWSHLMDRCLENPHIAYVKFSSSSNMNKGNLIFHEVCKHNPPIHVLEPIHDANESAVMTKGYGGYFPLHNACASGASEEVIRYLISKYPQALSTAAAHDHATPLHLACKVGASEDMFMLLLIHYPEAAALKDDFGRLPLDYAKNIRSPCTRDVAIKCLATYKWLQESKKTTTSEIERSIRGYEESQAKQLKMIKESHEKEIAELESDLHSLEKQLTKQSNVLKRVEAELRRKNEENEKQAKSLIAKVGELTEALHETRDANEALSKEIEERTNELELALDDVETLNQHSEWLESMVTSIRKIANSEAPLVKSLHRRDESQRLRDSDAKTERSLWKGCKEGGPAPKSGKAAYTGVDDEAPVEAESESRSDSCESELNSVVREGAE